MLPLENPSVTHTPPTTSLQYSPTFSQWCGKAFLNLLLFGLWVVLFWPITDYLSLILLREDFRTTQFLLLFVIILFCLRAKENGFHVDLAQQPHLRVIPLLLFMGGSTAFVLAERFLDMNTISVTLAVFSGYGMIGFWMGADAWRQRLPAAFMVIGLLPFGEHLQTFVGYPMRIATAQAVGNVVQLMGVPTVGVDTILIFENGISHVDLPCSGVKSLWTGALFLATATWIERRSLTLRWWGIAICMALLLFLTNFARVLILVLVGQVGGFQLVAEMMHVPLGVLSFVICCGITLILLRTVCKNGPDHNRLNNNRLDYNSPDQNGSEGESIPGAADLTQATLLEKNGIWRRVAPWGVAAALAMLIALYSPRPLTGVATAANPWQFDSQLKTEPLPLPEAISARFIRDGAEAVERVRFEWQGNGGERITGSMILITSQTWRAHHRPERCFEVYGLSLDQSATHLTATQQPIRSVLLGNGQAESIYSATYWFQSSTRTTDDYSDRIWSDLQMDREPWVLVSILFDDVYDLSDPQVDGLIHSVHSTVDEQW